MKKLSYLLLLLLIAVSCQQKPEKTEVYLIPMPVELELHSGMYKMNKKTEIAYQDDSLEGVAQYLAKELSRSYNLEMTVLKKTVCTKGFFFELDTTLVKEEAYRIDITKKGVRISAKTPKGALLSIQTILQLITHLKDQPPVVYLPCLHIDDAPEWEWRGLMLDVARHFYSKEEVMNFLDMMAFYKFNKFHWHLSDDQGWRVEIKKYPLLTEEGGWRFFNRHDKTVLQRAKEEHNSDFLLPDDKLRKMGDSTQYGGYYIQEDIREVITYAMERGIEVIPEIDMPGHFSAAIASYPGISCFEKAGWGNTFSFPVCLGKDRAVQFCEDILEEVIGLFPSSYIHIGADEVEKINWEKCPDCQARIKTEGLKDEQELQAWFVKRIAGFLHRHGKQLIGWDEIIEGGLPEGATVMCWRSWMKDAAHKATSQGNQVILAPNSHFYFDYKQDHSTLRKLYQFSPVPAGLSPEQHRQIKGIQANIWMEWIPSVQRLQYMAFPRIVVMSELAWRNDSVRDWEEFYPRLVHEFERLDAMKVNYRPLDLQNVHVTNSFVGETLVNWEYLLPKIEIRYTTDGTIPDKASFLYQGPFKLDKTTDFIIRFFRPDGTAADIIKTSYRKEDYMHGSSLREEKRGVRCAWHELIARKCSDIEGVPVKARYELEDIIIPESVGGKRGLVYTGFLNIEKEGVYTFSLTSDDGSMFYMYDEIIVDNDGPHGSVTLAGQKVLGKGLHPFKLLYFDMNNGGELSLKVHDQEGKPLMLKDHLYYSK